MFLPSVGRVCRSVADDITRVDFYAISLLPEYKNVYSDSFLRCTVKHIIARHVPVPIRRYFTSEDN